MSAATPPPQTAFPQAAPVLPKPSPQDAEQAQQTPPSQRPQRNLETEHADSKQRRYAYDFDYLMHHYMLRSFAPFFPRAQTQTQAQTQAQTQTQTQAPAAASTHALELGCYKGHFTGLLAPHFDTLTVVEGAADLIAEARANVPKDVRFIHDCFESVRFSDEARFDAVFLQHTLEHLDDPVAVLKRIHSWLGETGRLFLVVPNAHAASRQIATHMGLLSHHACVSPGEWQHGHRRTYTFDTLERDVRAAGLRVLHRSGIMFKPLANFQFDKALQAGVIDGAFLDGCFDMGKRYPELCASIFLLVDGGHCEWTGSIGT